MNHRTLSSAGLHALTDEEGFVAVLTPDCHGYPTIGFGHRQAEGESFPRPITHEEAHALKRQDLKRFEAAVNGLTAETTQAQFDAMVLLSYNIGVAGFESSSVYSRFEAGDVAGAADSFLPWCMARNIDTRELEVDLVLAGRRWRERARFLESPASDWHSFQTVLAEHEFYAGTLDGIPGPLTLAAVTELRAFVLAGGAV
jgi:lysozyme